MERVAKFITLFIALRIIFNGLLFFVLTTWQKKENTHTTKTTAPPPFLNRFLAEVFATPYKNKRRDDFGAYFLLERYRAVVA